MVFNDKACSASFKAVSTVTGTGSSMLNVSYVCSAITFTTLLPKRLKVGNVLVSFLGRVSLAQASNLLWSWRQLGRPSTVDCAVITGVCCHPGPGLFYISVVPLFFFKMSVYLFVYFYFCVYFIYFSETGSHVVILTSSCHNWDALQHLMSWSSWRYIPGAM